MFHPSERIALAATDRSTSPTEWLRITDGLHARSVRDSHTGSSGDSRRASGAGAGFWWLDSALEDGRLGRLSFAGTDPYLWLTARDGEVEIDVRRDVRAGLERGVRVVEADALDFARSLLPRADSLVCSTRAGSTDARSSGGRPPRWHEVAGRSAGFDLPFIGGAVGYLGYELASLAELGLQFNHQDDLALPDLSLAYVDRVLAYDHAAERLFMFGLGFSDGRASAGAGPRETAVARSRHVADALAAEVEWILAEGPPVRLHTNALAALTDLSDQNEADAGEERVSSSGVSPETLEIASTVDASDYVKAVDLVLQEIEAGNLYQANFSQRLTIDAPARPWDFPISASWPS